MGIGDWGLGVGDWGMGDGANTPAPVPQYPSTNPPSPTPHLYYY